MATTTTTLSSAVAVTDTSVNLTSLTSVAAGVLILVDDEVMKVTKGYNAANPVPVMRGQLGTVGAAHVSGANATHGVPSDFDGALEQSASPFSFVPVVRKVSYIASGAITPPRAGEWVMAKLLGTDALTMTLADPGEEDDGALIFLVATGKAAHTVTITNGLGAGSTSSDVGTFSASYAGGCILMAVNGKWNMVGAGLYSATGATGAPTWA